MAFNGSGVYSLAAGNPVVTGTVISSTWANNTLNDIATGLTTALCKDGQSTPTANIKMGGFKFTGLGAGTLNGDSVRFEQLPSATNLLPIASGGTGAGTGAAALASLGIQIQAASSATTTGTAPTYAAALTPSITALAANKTRSNLTFHASSPGVAATLDLGTGPIGLKQYDNTGTKVDPTIVAGMMGDVVYDGTHWVIVDSLPSVPAQIQPISASVAGNALTISAGALSLDFRSAVATGSGTVTRVNGTPASLTIGAGSTAGTSNGVPARFWVLALNNAATIELAFINTQGASYFAPLNETSLISTTAMTGAVNSAGVIYSAAARTGVAFRILGYIELTEATAGTYATAPSVIQGMGPGVKRPGDIVQVVTNGPQAGVTTTSTAYTDVTGFSVAIQPTSNVNQVRIDADLTSATTNAAATNNQFYYQLLRNATPTPGTDQYTLEFTSGSGGSGVTSSLSMGIWDRPQSSAAITYKIQHRCGGVNAPSLTSYGTQMIATEYMV